MTQPHDDVEASLALRLTLLNLTHGYRIAQAIYVAAVLGLADPLVDGSKSADELAQATSAHAPSLARLLRTLAAFDVLQETSPGRFALTALGQYLRADHPQSVRDAVLMFGSEDFWRTWGDLLHCVKTGESATRHLFGVANPFQHYAKHPELNALVNAGFAANGRVRADAVVAAYDFSNSGAVVDVGGGLGQLVTTILRAYPGLRGILFDQLHVVSDAMPLVEAAGVAERLEIVAGDMFAEIPSGGDTYLLMNILHDWDDAQALTILKNCHQAMRPQSTLLLIEQLLPNPIVPAATAESQTLADLNMLVRTGGQERTEEEYRSLLEAARFELVSVLPTQTAHRIIQSEWRPDTPSI